MLITDKLVYLELHKTGCTFTRLVLAELFSDSCRIVGKHNLVETIPQDVLGDFETKTKIGNIRNPWDWYVSLWAFGCQKKGGLRDRLLAQKGSLLSGREVFQKLLFGDLKFKHPMPDKEVWMWLYSDPYNCAHFNAWLKLLLSFNEPDIGEDFKSTELSRFAGFLTYRYLRLYTIGNGLNRIGSFDALRNYDSTENFLDETIKMERVNLDIERLATRFNISRESCRRILHSFKRKPNKSKREEDYRYYYTADSVELVQVYEKLIIEKHSYAFE